MSEGEEPAPEGWTFLNIDCGDTGVFILTYCIIFCKVLKKDATRFEEALGRLKDKMLLLGHKDYSEACGEIAKMIDEGTKVRKRK